MPLYQNRSCRASQVKLMILRRASLEISVLKSYIQSLKQKRSAFVFHLTDVIIRLKYLDNVLSIVFSIAHFSHVFIMHCTLSFLSLLLYNLAYL
jgi:hypothetical protein